MNSKYLFRLISVLLLCSSFSGARISRISILYVSKNIETPYRISCKMFNSSFRTQFKKKVIDTRSQIDSFYTIFNTIEYEKKSEDIDVRVKIYIFGLRPSPILMCMDRFDDVLVNDRLIKRNINLLNFINYKIEE
jgi:hypothetical protein